MSKALAVGLVGLVLFYGEPNLIDMALRYVQIKVDAYDMKVVVCPD